MDYRKHLTENVLPFWLEHSQDYENGGIFTNLDRDGRVFDTDKCVWFQGRALWSFAVAYNTIEKRQEYLDICERAYSFFPKCTSASWRMPFHVKADGTTVLQRDFYYSEAFAAIGCAQYYRATGRREVWESAKKYFDVCADMYRDPVRRTPELTQRFDPCRVFGIHMIMLSTAQFMRNVGIDTEKYDAIAREAIAEMRSGGYINDELKAIIEYPDLNGSFRNTPEGRNVCPGHAYEAAWFVMLEGEIKNDASLRELGRKILDYAMPEGFEKETSVIPTCRDVFGMPMQELILSVPCWWPQNEAIIAYALAYNIFGDKKYKALYEQIRDYAFEHFADRDGKEWFAYIDNSGSVINPLKGNLNKGPFHVPRMCMALASLEETGSILKYIS